MHTYISSLSKPIHMAEYQSTSNYTMPLSPVSCPHLSADVPSGSLLTLHRPALLRSSLYQTDASPPLPSVSLAERLAPFSFSPPCKPSSLFAGASSGGPGSMKSIFVTTYNCGGCDPEELDLHEMMQVRRGSPPHVLFSIYVISWERSRGVETAFSRGC